MPFSMNDIDHQNLGWKYDLRLKRNHNQEFLLILEHLFFAADSNDSRINVAPPPDGTNPSRFASKGLDAFVGASWPTEKAPKTIKTSHCVNINFLSTTTNNSLLKALFD